MSLKPNDVIELEREYDFSDRISVKAIDYMELIDELKGYENWIYHDDTRVSGINEGINEAMATAERMYEENGIDIVPCENCKYAHIVKTPKGEEVVETCDKITEDSGNTVQVYLPLNFFCAYGRLKDEFNP